MTGLAAPFLSVVIPTMGRDILIRTLESLAASEGFAGIEVIVAGRVPDAEVAARLKEYCGRHGNVRHLDIQFETGDSSRKKNEGAAAARAPLIAFLDDDVVVAPDWPKRISEPFADAQVGLASGPSLVPEDINRIGRLAGLVLSSRAAGYVAEPRDGLCHRLGPGHRMQRGLSAGGVCANGRISGGFLSRGGNDRGLPDGAGGLEAALSAGGVGQALSAAVLAAFLAADVGLRGDAHPAAAGGGVVHAVAADPRPLGGGDGGVAPAGAVFPVGARPAGGGAGTVCLAGAGRGGGDGGADAERGRRVAAGHDSLDAHRLWIGRMGRGDPARKGLQRKGGVTFSAPRGGGPDLFRSRQFFVDWAGYF